MPILYMSRIGRQMLIDLEGSSNVVYKDVAGLPTIGVGHLLTKDELSSGKIYIDGAIDDPNRGYAHYSGPHGITDAQIDALLVKDLRRFESTVIGNTTQLQQLTAGQFDALVSFAFNVGAVAFANSTLLKRVKTDKLDEVPGQFKRWVYAGGEVIPGLKNRREVEIERWLSTDDTGTTGAVA